MPTSEFFSYENKIIKDIKYLEEDFVPDKIQHRKEQIKEIARSIGQYIQYGSTTNLFLYGPPGTGKTTLVKFLFNKLEEETSKVKGVYVNCWKTSTGYGSMVSIASQISTSLGNVLKLKRTYGECYEHIRDYITKKGLKIIVCLDEVDKLEDDEILYFFSRDNIPLIMVSNNPYALKYIDDRVRSSLLYESIEFKTYTYEEILDILKERHKNAFYPDAFPQHFLKVCASNAKGDARIGIGIMKYAALSAEKKGKDKVEREDVLYAVEQAKKIKVMQILSTLKKEHEILYNIVEAHKEIEANKLYEEFSKTLKEMNLKDVTDRTFRNYMETLISKGLIEAKGDNRWRKYALKV